MFALALDIPTRWGRTSRARLLILSAALGIVAALILRVTLPVILLEVAP